MLYQEDMDKMTCQCGKPECEGALFLHSKCHLYHHLEAKYFKGELTLMCAQCDKIVAVVAVAQKPKLTS